MRSTALMAIAIAIASAACTSTQSAISPLHDDPPAAAEEPVAPAFVLTDLSGHKLDLSRYKGKVVLLDFWATWCAPCREELPKLVKMQASHGNQGLQVIGISLDDSAAPVRALYAEFKLNYPVALGDARLAERYGGILGLPVVFLIGRDGRIAKRYADTSDTILIEHDAERLLRAPGAAGDLR